MEKIKVFISYANEDIEIAKKLYFYLKESGIIPWLDQFNLSPGQNWKFMINEAIKESNFFIALLSTNSVSKKGFVQKELKKALDILDEYPINETFVIPVRINECKPIDKRISDLHWVDIFPSYEKGFGAILSSILTCSESHENNFELGLISKNEFFRTKLACSSKLGFHLGTILIKGMSITRIYATYKDVKSLLRELITLSRSTQIVAKLLELSEHNQNDLCDLRNLIISFFEAQDDSQREQYADNIRSLVAALNPMLASDIELRHGSEAKNAFLASLYAMQGFAVFAMDRLGSSYSEVFYDSIIHSAANQHIDWFLEFCIGLKSSPLDVYRLKEYAKNFKEKKLNEMQLQELTEFVCSWPSKIYTYFCPPELLHEYGNSLRDEVEKSKLLSDILELSKLTAMRGSDGQQLIVENSDPLFLKSRHWIRRYVSSLGIPIDIIIDGDIVYKDSSKIGLNTNISQSEPRGETVFGWSIAPRIEEFLDCLYGSPAKILFKVGFYMRQSEPLLTAHSWDANVPRSENNSDLEERVKIYFSEPENRIRYIELLEPVLDGLVRLPISIKLQKKFQNATKVWIDPCCTEDTILKTYHFFCKEFVEGLVPDIVSHLSALRLSGDG